MLLTESEVGNLKGLCENEVRERIKKYGYNELPSSGKRGLFKIALGSLKEPMFLLLVACGMAYFFIGDIQEAILLLGFVAVIIGITIYQEGKTENALGALRDMSSPRALVVRNGEHKRIAGRDVVKDDIVLLREGDRVPADSMVLWERNLSVDESLLTGESVPVKKRAAENNSDKQKQHSGENSPFLYCGSLVVHGQSASRVITTGFDTEIGKIGKSLQNIREEKTPLQKQTNNLVKNIFIIVIVLCLVIVGFYWLVKNDWLGGILSGLTLAMAMIPEEFPVVLTIFLAMGAWRIAKQKVLARKISAVEILGACTVLCVDKTGTLTQNKMSIKKLFSCGKLYDVPDNSSFILPEEFHNLVEYGILASAKDPFDPMEKALRELGKKTLANTEHIHKKWLLAKEYPLSKELMALSHICEFMEQKKFVVSSKGAPEAIASLCHMNSQEKKEMAKHANAMASEGLRVLGVARSFLKSKEFPSSQHDFEFEFMGLMGFADPIRETVPSAIKECYSAGIKVIMITGDYSTTAKNIGRQIGLRNPDEAVSGHELQNMNSEVLKKRIENVNIFSRMAPEQKLSIVDVLKSNGEIVAMTGDGVNDAPALRSAHIGIAMGERGTDVARESSEMVLLDDNFSTIVEAVKMGRRIYDNLKKAMAYIVSVHIPIAGVSLIPVLAGWPVVLYPIHIAFLELIIDPACSTVFELEPSEPNIMKRPPRNSKQPLFGKKMLLLSSLQGLFSMLIVIAVFKMALDYGQSEEEARALSFAVLIISNICLILTNRSWSKNIVSSLATFNKALFWVVSGAISFLAIVLYVPSLRNVFHFGPMHPDDVLIFFTAGILSIVWFELIKFVCRRKNIELLED